MKYIKCNLAGYDVKFKIIIQSIDVRDCQYILQIKYKFRPRQIFGYYIYLDRVWDLDKYRTISDKDLINKVKSDIVNDILRRTSFKRKI